MRFSIGLLAAGAALLTGTCVAAHHACATAPRQARTAAVPGPLVLERAAAIARLRFPSVEDIGLECSPVDVLLPTGGTIPTWQVVCRGDAGSELGTVYLDADTGAPMAAYFAASSPGEHAGREPVDGHDAVKAAWRWLRVLGMAGRSGAWRLSPVPRCENGQWTVRWTGPGWRACAVVDAMTCDLMYARFMPWSLPAAPAARLGASRPL